MPVDLGRPQAASPPRTAQRASGSGFPGAAPGSGVLQRRRAPRGLSPGRARRGPSGLPSARPAPAEPRVLHSRRARDGARGERSSASSPRCQPPSRPAARRPQPAPADPRPPVPAPHLRRAPAPSVPPGPAVYTGSDVRGRPRPRPRRPLRFPGRSPPSPRARWAAAQLSVSPGASRPSRRPAGGLGCVLTGLSLKLMTETLIARHST